jgi:undecaprenyl-diphosphatase
MALWFAAVLGLVQGLTEFVPVSSTAHLRIIPEFLGQADPGAAFSAVIQLGTLLAVIAYFARELFIEIPRGVFKDPKGPDGRLALYLVVGTIPIVVAGLGLKSYITGSFRSLYVVSAALAVVGGVMIWADQGTRKQRTMLDLTMVDGIVVGCAQALALVPGVSRSGSTIIAALFLGMARPDAARFSFLLGIPAIAGAGLYELKDAIDQFGDSAVSAIVVGTLAAAVSGYLAIAWLMRFLSRHSLAPFGVYRILLGLLLAGLCVSGILAP